MLAPEKQAREILVDVIGEPKGNTALALRKQEKSARSAEQVQSTLNMFTQSNGYKLKGQAYDGDTQTFVNGLVDQLTPDRMGRWRLLEEGRIEYYWYETKKKGGILKNTYTTDIKLHRIARPFWHKLPYRGYMPKHVQEIAAQIEAVPALKKAARVLTGTLCLENYQVDSVRVEDTKLNTGIKALGRGAKKVAVGVAAAGAAVGAGVGTVAAFTAKAAGTVVVAADPAIVIGELVIVGFKEKT